MLIVICDNEWITAASFRPTFDQLSLLKGICQSNIDQKVHRIDSVCVLRDGQGSEAIEESHQIRCGGCVLRPADACVAIWIEVGNEVDDVVLELATSERIQDVRGMGLEY